GAALKAIVRADVVHTWLYHGNVLGGVLAAFFRPILWSLHATELEPAQTKWMTRVVVRMAALLSHVIPDQIAVCAERSRSWHVRCGYPESRMVLLPNGANTDEFVRDEEQRRRVRREWGVEGQIVVGLVARYHPQKDHANFIRSAAIAVSQVPRLRFVLCGNGADCANAALEADLVRLGIRERFILLGHRSDVREVLSALDIFTLSSSFGEAFPLALCEAMSCSLPTVVTDVGDCAMIVGTTGRVVAPNAPGALAAQIVDLAQRDGDELKRIGGASRQRVVENFGLAKIVRAYEECYRGLARTKMPKWWGRFTPRFVTRL
ncbi:MAG: glycosyltransferase, partial [Methylococcaceae bacterium]|nr:glycosyltransferase [Methylococcaceae bacterium]